jgi:hypothetical protein
VNLPKYNHSANKSEFLHETLNSWGYSGYTVLFEENLRDAAFTCRILLQLLHRIFTDRLLRISATSRRFLPIVHPG